MSFNSSNDKLKHIVIDEGVELYEDKKGEWKMKKMKKMLAVFMATTLVASIMVGVRGTNTIEASEESIELSNWTFTQGGMYNPAEEGNEGYINSVTMNGTNEKLTGWLKGNKAGEADPSVNQTMTAKEVSNGFTIDIENTGWDCMWKSIYGYPTDRINPWSVLTSMNNVTIKEGHIYTVRFNAKSSKKKYAYVEFGSDIDNQRPYGENELDGKQVIAITPTEQTYTYKFTNWISAKKLNTTIMLGAFGAKYDCAGNDISSIVTDVENKWKGTVTVSNFEIIDEGLSPDYGPFNPEPEKPTLKPQPTTPEITTEPVEDEGENLASNVEWNWFSVCPLDGESTLDEEHNGHVQGENGSKEHPYCWYHVLTNIRTSERPNGYVEGADFATKGWVVPGTTASDARLYAQNTGWDAAYNGEVLADDNPYGLRFYTSNIQVKKNCTYTLSFKYTSDIYRTIYKGAQNENEEIYTKHIGLEIVNPQDGSSLNFTENSGCTKYGIFLADKTADEKTITVKFKIPADYEGENVFIQLNAGAYLLSYPDEIGMKGSLYVKDLKLVAKESDNPTTVQPATEQPTTEPEKPTTVEPVTVAPTTKDTQTKAEPANVPTKTIAYDKPDKTTDNPSVSKPLGATSVTKAAKSKKATRVSVTFKKINGAAKYQVQISTSKKFKKVLVNKIVKKVKVTISSKKLKNKKKLYIRVRAVGTDKWSKPKKIKIK